MSEVVWDSEDAAFAQDALDDLYTVVGKNVLLVYPPLMTSCANCVASPEGHGHTTFYRSGGPIFFPDGQTCPVCGGTGTQRETETTETVRLVIATKPEEFWVKLPESIQDPKGVIQVKGLRTVLPQVLKAREMVVSLQGQRQRYTVSGEPIDGHNLVPNRYFILIMTRIG